MKKISVPGAIMLWIAGCTEEPATALRVVHLGPDAPNIDAFVDGRSAVTDLAFTDGSDTIAIAPGLHEIDIAPAGAGVDGSVLTIPDLLVEQGTRYTAFAFGDLANLQASTVVDSTQGLATGHVRLRVIHTGFGVGTVDVYAIRDGAEPDLLAADLRYGSASEPIDLPTDAFTAGIDADADGDVDLTYAIPALPAGEVVNVFATVDAAGDVFLLAQLPNETLRFDVVRQGLRVVHLSPDAPAVTPLFDGAPLGQIAFPSSTDYAALTVSQGTLDVTTDGTPATSVLSAPVALEEGRVYTAVALGRVANLGALVFEDDRSRLAANQIRVRAIHGAPDVGQVDVYDIAADGTATEILSDIDFGTAADPIDLPAGAYTLGVDANNDATPDLYFALPQLDSGLANLYVTQDADGTVFALAQLDGATTVRIDTAESEVRVLHLSRDAPNVDVYVSGTAVISNLPFKSQSPSLTVPSGSLPIAVTAAGAPIGTAVISTNVRLLPDRAYTILAYDDLASIDAVVLEDDTEGLAAGNIRVPITHVAPQVTRGDVYELLDGATMFGAQLVDDFGFGETPPAVDLPAGTYTIGFDAEANGDVQAIFDLPLLTPGTYARAHVFQEADGSVAVLVQLTGSVVVVPAR